MGGHAFAVSPRRRTAQEKSDLSHWAGTEYGTARCQGCSVVYHRKRWYLSGTLPEGVAEGVPRVTCPACRKARNQSAEGSVMLAGDFFAAHKGEILNRIRHEEARARAKNPLERIIAIKEMDGRAEILTTNEKLAQRIGLGLKKAFKGSVKYLWSRGNKLLRVRWSRWMRDEK